MPYALIISAVLLLLFAVVHRVVRSVRMTDTMRRITRESRADARRSASAARLGVWQAALIPAPVPASPVPASPAAPAKRPAIIPSPAQPVTSSAERPCTVAIPRELQTPLIVHNPGAPIGNNKFYKQVVCFTGTIPGMTRAKAMAAVEANGGTAFEHMPKHPTILVKGDKPGRAKLEAAASLGDACHVIDASVFLGMVSAPLALEPDELIRYLPKLLGKEVAIA